MSTLCVRCKCEFVPWRDSDEVCWECQGPRQRPTGEARPLDLVPEAQADPRAPESTIPAVPLGRRESAVVWLAGLLSDGPVAGSEVVRLARNAAIAEKTLKRAKRALGVRSERQGGLGAAGHWAWRLPEQGHAEETQ
jgi:hypothetical protein